MTVASSPPCLAPMSSQMTRGVGQVKWHPLFSLSRKSLPSERAAQRLFFLSRPLISLSRWYFVWVFGVTSFLSKRDSVLCIRVRQWLRKPLTLRCYTSYQRSIMIEKIGFSRVWSCSPSERCSPRGGHGTDIMPISYFFCEKRGVWWAICGTFSPSNLESSMMDTMSSCSGGMSKLMEMGIHQICGPPGWTLLSPSLDS